MHLGAAAYFVVLPVVENFLWIHVTLSFSTFRGPPKPLDIEVSLLLRRLYQPFLLASLAASAAVSAPPAASKSSAACFNMCEA